MRLKTISVLTAMPQELDAVLKTFNFANPEKVEIFGMSVYISEHNGIKFVLALSGVGRANTAMNTALIAKEFKPDEIINVGSAGGLQNEQKILDIVIPNEIVAVDVDLTALGCEYGQMLGDQKSYFADAKIQEKLINSGKGLATVHTGTIGSSEAFVCREEQVQNIRSRFNNSVVCVEMEAYSIAIVCKRFNIPFAIIRSLSDVPAHGEGNEHDFNAFLDKASDNAAKLLYKYAQ